MSKAPGAQVSGQALITTDATMMKSSFLHMVLLPLTLMVTRANFANITLSSLGGDLSATVYLPAGIKPNESSYYLSSRFEHGSMIGSITRTKHEISLPANGQEPVIRTHQEVLYGTDLWRVPHDPYWPESGVGLASEFGVGDDGSLCLYRCGWRGVDDVTNGLLGYQEAKNGESFLKIGVGELIKGSCQACDSTDDYKFNSPYQFAKQPVWTMSQPSQQTVILEHEATLNNYGYRLRKDVSLLDNLLLVRTTLTNLGNRPFSTVWYSHHFFGCDGAPVGKGYSADLQLRAVGPKYFEEPGALFWSSPIRNYAQVAARPDSVHISMLKTVEDGTRIKTEFLNDPTSTGAFTINACGSSIQEIIAELSAGDIQNGRLSMYGFNFYIERGTFSPEPQYLVHLEPGATQSWTQRLQFGDIYESEALSAAMLSSTEYSASAQSSHLLKRCVVTVAIFVIPALLFVLLHRQRLAKKYRHSYVQIPDNQEEACNL